MKWAASNAVWVTRVLSSKQGQPSFTIGCNFAVHYSLDGEKFDMVRLYMLPMENTIKVGIEAQCPMGQSGVREFSGLSIEKRSISNLRAGK